MDENAALVRRLYEAFNRRDTEATRGLMDPEIEWVNAEEAVEPGTRHGFDEYQDSLRRVREVFRDAEIELDHLVESGDRVATRVRMHAHLDASGMDTTMPQSHLWTFREGKAVRFEWSPDPEHAFRGLSDSSS
jgi:ketosteroid isomerase-like protein